MENIKQIKKKRNKKVLKKQEKILVLNKKSLKTEERIVNPNKKTIKTEERIVILHNIRSSENVGAMLRTADAGGVQKVYLTGYTPAPYDKFGRKNTRLTKASLGAEDFVIWEKQESIFSVITKLKKTNYHLVGVEQAKTSVHYKKIKNKEKIAYIMGAEVEGIPKAVLNKCNQIAEIPMQGKKESLNVSVSLGIVLFS